MAIKKPCHQLEESFKICLISFFKLFWWYLMWTRWVKTLAVRFQEAEWTESSIFNPKGDDMHLRPLSREQLPPPNSFHRKALLTSCNLVTQNWRYPWLPWQQAKKIFLDKLSPLIYPYLLRFYGMPVKEYHWGRFNPHRKRLFYDYNCRLFLKHLYLKEILLVKGKLKVTLRVWRRGIPHETCKVEVDH